MKKVLIADDDFLVRTYLKQLIDWEKQGFSIVGEAKNGQDALELIKSTAPDLVITDICMPIMDGIELIRRLKAENISCHILVLSSHDDFNYVREALKLGIDDYLLKDNLTPKHILDFLQEHIKETDDNLTTATDTELLKIGKEKLRADFLAAFTAGTLTAENIAAAGSKAGINPSFSMAAGILIELRGCRARKVNLTETIRELGESSIKRFLPSARSVIFKLAEYDNLWGIFIFLDAASKAAAAKAILEISAQLSRQIRNYMDLAMIAGLSNLAPTLFAFMQEWVKLVGLREGFFYLPSGAYQLAKIPVVNNEIASTKEITLANFSDCCQENLLASSARQELANKLKLNAEEIAELKSADDIEELAALMEGLLKAKDARKNIHPSIAQAISLIENHYREPLTQPDIAAAVHLNPAYFSTLFKKNVGKGFREFLAERRIVAVKEQLLSSTERIKDIATAAGFEDYPYFCRLFKQLTGLSPQEFRLQSLK